MAEKLRQAYINSIMSKQDGDDNETLSREFLELLTLEELQDLSDEVIPEETL
jgi:hypothetical protein